MSRQKENLVIASSGSPVPGSRISVLVISVSDTGKGIPVEELPTIFDEYRQAEGSESSVQKGTGLGLSITKKFAELLGGSIGVESEVGKGSTFTLRVPADYQGLQMIRLGFFSRSPQPPLSRSAFSKGSTGAPHLRRRSLA